MKNIIDDTALHFLFIYLVVGVFTRSGVIAIRLAANMQAKIVQEARSQIWPDRDHGRDSYINRY